MDIRLGRRGLLSLAALSLVGVAASSIARLPAPPAALARAPDALGAAYDALTKGRYLAAVDGLRAAVAGGDKSAASMLAQVEPYITGHPATPGPNVKPMPLDAATVRQLKGATARDAITEIVARARRTRIVILNEAHDTPRHRAFGLEVARALRPLGYTLLAMEALANDANPQFAAKAMETLAADRHPRRGTGFYLMDPVFADFVRQALAIGYRPLAYEQTNRGAASGVEGIIAREQAQAENLVEHLSAAGPDARLLIYVGHSHVAEAALPPGEQGNLEWMAARLKRMTRIDPLTIEQTELRGRAYNELLQPLVRRPSAVLFLRNVPLRVGQYRQAVDLQIAHARPRLVGGRFDWLTGMGRRPNPIPPELRPQTGRRLVQAFLTEEPTDAIPIDQVLVEAGKPMPSLMLPAANIRYDVQVR